MAKNLRKFAPGYSDVTPADDVCEVIFLENRQNNGSEQSAIFGAQCGRWCVHGGAGTVPRNDSDWARPKTLVWDIFAPGSGGWGSCCCMGGILGGGGLHLRECHRAIPGDTYCTVIGSGGCCTPSSRDRGCNACVRSAATCCHSFVSAGHCGYSACYFDYCCYDCSNGSPNTATNKYGISLAFKTTAKALCSCYSLGDYSTAPGCAWSSGMNIGREPWSASRQFCGGKNCIPKTDKKGLAPYPGGGQTAGCKNAAFGDNCMASGECLKRMKNEVMKFGMSFDINECYNGCAVWSCGTKKFARVQYNDPLHHTSGSAYINYTQVNTNAWGGWNWNQWMHCKLGGNGAHNCHQNLRTIGMPGAPAQVCGGGCCCGGQGANGAIILRYR